VEPYIGRFATSRGTNSRKRSSQIIWTVYLEGNVAEIDTHQRIGHREIRGEYKSKFMKGEFMK
jgi:hypothetical protein